MVVEQMQESADFLRQQGFVDIDFAIVLGSGLSEVVDQMEILKCISYKEIPYFSTSTAMGHKSNLLLAKFGGKRFLVMQGRFHYYEGYEMEKVVFPIRVMHLLGIKNIILTNAAGGLNPNYRVGDLMLINDHINLFPNPLRGKNLEQFGPRFPDMTFVYNPQWREEIKKIANRHSVDLHEGVYIGSSGPTFETPAEYRYFRVIGGDAAGMSTVPEAIVAHHAGMKILGVSIITNEAHTFEADYCNDGADVLIAAQASAKSLALVLESFINEIA